MPDGTSVREFITEMNKDPEFRVEQILSDISFKIAEKVKECREARRISQKVFGRKLKLSQSQISKLESPSQCPNFTLRSLAKIADILNCELVVDLVPKENRK